MEATPPCTRATRAALAAFRCGSGRFLFAARRDREALTFLEQGSARERRVEARTRLRCPEPGCAAPEITTVSRSATGARDGFRHLLRPTVDHAPESVFHRQAKALVARWARTKPGVADVAEEVRLGHGERVADVLLTSQTGNRLAVEIQYSALSVEDWSRRTESYRSLGVTVSWLWGHIGAHNPIQGRWRATAKALLAQGLPVLWINPAEEQILWAWDLGALHDRPDPPGPPDYGIGSLDDIEIRQTGLFPPGFLAARDEARARAERDRVEREEKERRRRERNIVVRARAEAARRAVGGPTWSGWFEPVGPPTPVRAMPAGSTSRACLRCGGALDPALTSGVHADPYCDR